MCWICLSKLVLVNLSCRSLNRDERVIYKTMASFEFIVVDDVDGKLYNCNRLIPLKPQYDTVKSHLLFADER